MCPLNVIIYKTSVHVLCINFFLHEVKLFFFADTEFECVFSASGSLSLAQKQLYQKALKALFNLKKT